ncbi:GH13_26 / GH13 / GH13_20 [Streptomyces misionensis JCM 4497]
MGGAARGAAVAVRALVRHRLGGRGRPGAAAGAGRTARHAAGAPEGRRRRPALPRPRAAAARRNGAAAAARAAGRPVVPPGVVAAGPHGAELPSLLQHLGADRGAGGGPRGVRRHPRQDPPAAGGGRGGRAARGPPGRARRPGRLSRAAARGDRRALDGGGEDPRRRRTPALLLAGRRHHRLRRPASGRRPVHGPGRRGGTPRRVPRLRHSAAGPRRGLGRHGTAGGLQGAHPRTRHRDRPAHPGRRPAVRDLPGPGAARPGALGAAHGPGGAAGPHAGLPALRLRRRGPRDHRGGRRGGAARLRGAGGGGGRRRRAPAAGGAARRPGRAGPRRPGGAAHPVRADRLRAARQVGGGHGVLPLCAAAVGGRGGRRPGPAGGVAARVPRLLRTGAARLAAHRYGGHHARHQAQRRRPRGPRGAHRMPVPLGGAGGRGDPAAAGRARRAAGLGGLADGVRTGARRGGAGARGPAEACAGGGHVHQLDRAGGAVRGCGGCLRGERSLRAARRPCGRLPQGAGAAHPRQCPRHRPGPSDDAGGPGRLPGRRGRVPGPGGPGQPPPGRLPARVARREEHADRRRAAAARPPPRRLRLRRLPHSPARRGPRCGALHGLRPLRGGDHRGHPSLAAAGRVGRLAGHRPAPASRPLDRRPPPRTRVHRPGPGGGPVRAPAGRAAGTEHGGLTRRHGAADASAPSRAPGFRARPAGWPRESGCGRPDPRPRPSPPVRVTWGRAAAEARSRWARRPAATRRRPRRPRWAAPVRRRRAGAARPGRA